MTFTGNSVLLAMNLEIDDIRIDGTVLTVRYNKQISATKLLFSPVVAMPDVRNLFKVLAVIFAKVSWC